MSLTITKQEAALLKQLDVPISPGSLPVAILRLTRMVSELQKRCDRLESAIGAQPRSIRQRIAQVLQFTAPEA